MSILITNIKNIIIDTIILYIKILIPVIIYRNYIITNKADNQNIILSNNKIENIMEYFDILENEISSEFNESNEIINKLLISNKALTENNELLWLEIKKLKKK